MFPFQCAGIFRRIVFAPEQESVRGRQLSLFRSYDRVIALTLLSRGRYTRLKNMVIASLNNASASSARNTMPLSAVIVDDEQLARDELAYLLKNLGDVNVVAQGKNGLEAVNLIKEHAPDLVFLDVQMPGLDGFGVIKKLLDRKIPLPKIVFATAFDQYAVKAFEVNAVDYILKPFDKKRVALSVEKARAKIEAGVGPEEKFDALVRMLESQKPQTAKILIKATGRLFLTDPKDICYATIEDGVITVATSGHAGLEGQSNCRTLEELFDSLDPNLFWRAHRSFLVNINHIREVVPWFKSSYQLRMDDKKQTEIPVSRAQTRRLRELFNL
jgi:two-component system LytT family response regulator/two-component system response regulator LytT